MARRSRHKPSLPLQTAQVRVEAIGARGDGIARVDEKELFIPYSAPGDIVDVEFRGQRGKIKKIITPSAFRRQAPCEYFGRCGGCALQHLTDEHYHDWKHNLVVEALAREGFRDDVVVKPLITCPPASRRRASFAVSKSKAGLQFGFNRKRSSEIININDCLVLAPSLNGKVKALRDFAEIIPHKQFDLSVTLCDNGLDVNIVSTDDLLFDGNAIEKLGSAMSRNGIIRLSENGDLVIALKEPVVSFGGVIVTPPSGGFLQASREGEAVLTNIVEDVMHKAKHIAELFCGAGTFSLPLGKNAPVDAFDSDGPAIDALDQAARQAGLRFPVKAHRRNLFDQPLNAAELKKYDAVIFDPPRAGAQIQTGEIAKSSVPLVVGVSCNPVTFARDAALLRDGGYRLQTVTPVDQFVYGAHVELVGVFER